MARPGLIAIRGLKGSMTSYFNGRSHIAAEHRQPNPRLMANSGHAGSMTGYFDC